MSPLPATSELFRDITHSVREGGLGRCVGRDSSVADLIAKLTQNGLRRILIVGAEGTGKLNLLEGALSALLTQDASRSISIFELNAHALRAGTVRMHELGQILETGRLRDEEHNRLRLGRTLLILVMGGGHLTELNSLSEEGVRAQASKTLPEALVRLTPTVVPFGPMRKKAGLQVIRAMIESYHRRIKTQKIVLRIHESVYESVLDLGLRAGPGARGLEEALERIVFNPIQQHLDSGDVPPRSILAVKIADGEAKIEISLPGED